MSTMHQSIVKNAKRLIVCSSLLVVSLFCFSLTCFAELVEVDPEISSFAVDKTFNTTVTLNTIDVAIESLSASATTLEVGNPVYFTTTVKNGTGTPNFTYTFKANDTTIKTVASSERTVTYRWTPTEVGTYTIKALVKDSTAKVVSTTITITVTDISTEVEQFNTVSESDFLLMIFVVLLILIFICAIKFFVL